MKCLILSESMYNTMRYTLTGALNDAKMYIENFDKDTFNYFLMQEKICDIERLLDTLKSATEVNFDAWV